MELDLRLKGGYGVGSIDRCFDCNKVKGAKLINSNRKLFSFIVSTKLIEGGRPAQV